MPKQSLSNTGIFSVKDIIDLFFLGTPSASALHLGAILKSEIINKKYNNVKTCSKWALKGHLFTVLEDAKNEEGKALPCSTSAVNVQIK